MLNILTEDGSCALPFSAPSVTGAWICELTHQMLGQPTSTAAKGAYTTYQRDCATVAHGLRATYRCKFVSCNILIKQPVAISINQPMNVTSAICQLLGCTAQQPASAKWQAPKETGKAAILYAVSVAQQLHCPAVFREKRRMRRHKRAYIVVR
jgi:hypothetical protein